MENIELTTTSKRNVIKENIHFQNVTYQGIPIGFLNEGLSHQMSEYVLQFMESENLHLEKEYLLYSPSLDIFYLNFDDQNNTRSLTFHIRCTITQSTPSFTIEKLTIFYAGTKVDTDVLVKKLKLRIPVVDSKKEKYYGGEKLLTDREALTDHIKVFGCTAL